MKYYDIKIIYDATCVAMWVALVMFYVEAGLLSSNVLSPGIYKANGQSSILIPRLRL